MFRVMTKERRRIDPTILRLDYTMASGGGAERTNFYLGIYLKEDYKKRVASMDTMAKG
jgi:hypothetical protein